MSRATRVARRVIGLVFLLLHPAEAPRDMILIALHDAVLVHAEDLQRSAVRYVAA